MPIDFRGLVAELVGEPAQPPSDRQVEGRARQGQTLFGLAAEIVGVEHGVDQLRTTTWL